MKKLVLLSLIILSFIVTKAQIWNTTYTNIDAHPAYAGLEGKSNINIARQTSFNAMSAITPGLENVLIAYDMPLYFKKDKQSNYIGIGATFENNRIENEKRRQMSLSFAYHLSFGKDSFKHKLSFGIQPATFTYGGINPISLYFGQQYNSTYPNNYYPNIDSSGETFAQTQTNSFDFGIGTWYSYKNLIIGVSLLHIARPNIQLLATAEPPERLPMNLNTIIQYSIKVGNSSIIPIIEFNKKWGGIALSPQVIFDIKQKIMLGIDYKNMNTIILKAGVNLFQHLRLYVGGGLFLKNPSLGNNIELGLRYQFNPYKKSKL